VVIAPRHANAQMNLGNILRLGGRLDEALEHYREAVESSPDYAQAHMNLGAALRAVGRLDEAESTLRHALRLSPEFAETWVNLGNVRRDRGRLDEAEAAYREAVSLRADDADATYSLGYLYLLQGDFERGWPLYEARWNCRDFPRYPSWPSPRWDGSPLEGRTILLFAEQGLGDTMQFVRFATLVKSCGGTVLLRCPASLAGLLARAPGIDRVIAAPDIPAKAADLPAHDVNAALLSLPAILGTTLATIPAECPYLLADERRVAHWRRVLGREGDALNVAILWQGNPKNPNDRVRSFPLRNFAPLAEIPGVRLIAIQKFHGSEQVRDLAGEFPLPDLAPSLDESFEDTAAVMRSVDLVIGPDTAGIHLAGALGVRAWMPLSSQPEFRWLVGREDSPWYPTLRIFRQATPGCWDDVFRRLGEALRSLVVDRRGPCERPCAAARR
jgi:hypothetical protein